MPGSNENNGVPIESASANTVISGTFADGEVAIKIVKQADFDYFTDLILPHPVTFIINVTYPVPGDTTTEDVTITANLAAFEEKNDGAVVNPVYYYTFTFV